MSNPNNSKKIQEESKKSLDNGDLLDNAKVAPSNKEDGFTMSPDGKYKIPKPKKHATLLTNTPSRIPYITGDINKEYEFYWVTDREPNSIPLAIQQGWEFVDPNTAGCENAKEPVYAGVRADGTAYFHYALWMPKGKFAEIQQLKQSAIDDKEQEILQRPSAEGSAIYATEQMKISTSTSPAVSS